MAYDGLQKTGVYFPGVKHVCQAHYPKIADYVEETLPDADEVRAFIKKHTQAGANVAVHEHKWVEVFIGSSWHNGLDTEGRHVGSRKADNE